MQAGQAPHLPPSQVQVLQHVRAVSAAGVLELEARRGQGTAAQQQQQQQQQTSAAPIEAPLFASLAGFTPSLAASTVSSSAPSVVSVGDRPASRSADCAEVPPEVPPPLLLPAAAQRRGKRVRKTTSWGGEVGKGGGGGGGGGGGSFASGLLPGVKKPRLASAAHAMDINSALAAELFAGRGRAAPSVVQEASGAKGGGSFAMAAAAANRFDTVRCPRSSEDERQLPSVRPVAHPTASAARGCKAADAVKAQAKLIAAIAEAPRREAWEGGVTLVNAQEAAATLMSLVCPNLPAAATATSVTAPVADPVAATPVAATPIAPQYPACRPDASCFAAAANAVAQYRAGAAGLVVRPSPISAVEHTPEIVISPDLLAAPEPQRARVLAWPSVMPAGREALSRVSEPPHELGWSSMLPTPQMMALTRAKLLSA